MQSADLDELFNRIEEGTITEADFSTLRQLLSTKDAHLLQLGKYNINIAEGREIHIGDRVYAEITSEAIHAIVLAIQRCTAGKPKPGLETYFGVPYSRNTFFTGRNEVLEALHQDLSENSIQVLSGLGGMGKTQTAVEYAYRCYFDQFRVYDWVFWLRADTEANLTSDFANLAAQLQLPTADLKPEKQIPQVKQWLTTHTRWLLIFDNADNPEWLEPFLSHNPEGHVLLTSRASIFDRVGVRVPLSLEPLSDDAAVAFLFSRASRERTASEEQAAAELAITELGKLPLALEQAGAFILRRRLSFHTYLVAYRKRRLQQLEQVKPQTGKYPASVLTTWSLNFQAVEAANPASADVLRLSAMVAPDAIPYRVLTHGAAYLSEDLATCLQNDAEHEAEAQAMIELAMTELLEPLSQYSLIKWEAEHSRYNLHRLVQIVVRDSMTAETRCDWVKRAIDVLDAALPEVEFENWDNCAQLLPHALTVIELTRVEGHESERLAQLLNQTAVFLKAQGRYGEAEPLLIEALELRRRLLGNDHADVGQSLNNLALLYHAQGHYREAEPLHIEALELSKRLWGNEHPDVATSLNNLAALYSSQGRYEEAESLFIEALKPSKRLLGNAPFKIARTIHNLAVLYKSQGRYEEAEPLYLKALELRRQLLGNDHPDIGQSLNDLATLYSSQERYEEAESLYLEALELLKRLLDNDHPNVATNLNNLALLYESQGRYEEAEPLFTEALELRRRLLGNEHLDVVTSLNNLALLYHDRGQYREAEPLYVEALELTKRLLGNEHLDVAASLNNLASFYQVQGRYEEAAPFYREALEITEYQLGSNHPTTESIRQNYELCRHAIQAEDEREE